MPHLNKISTSLFKYTHEVLLPARWQGDTSKSLHYLFTKHDLSQAGMVSAHQQLCERDYCRPRIITPATLALASVFQPSFYHAVCAHSQHTNNAVSQQGSIFHPDGLALSLHSKVSDFIGEDLTKFWLQSVLFLAGVTLSAAVIQNRWSVGTLESKYARLWQAAILAERYDYQALIALNLKEKIQQLIDDQTIDSVMRFIQLKNLFSKALCAICPTQTMQYSTVSAQTLTLAQQERFGFLDDLKQVLGAQLVSVLVYGSSLNSDDYADYDVLLVVKDSEATLRMLAGKNPMYLGKELNIGVYTVEDFLTYQLISGDNLPDYALCLYGHVDVPVKTQYDLLARNFSFGYVRLRQLLGMAAFAAQHPLASAEDDKHNLFQYFAKIPLNVLKGIQGALQQPFSKVQAHNWCVKNIQFDLSLQQKLCQSGQPVHGISAAAWSTIAVLEKYNQSLSICLPLHPCVSPLTSVCGDVMAR